MDLFTPATDRALCCDAYLIDASRRVRPLHVEPLTPVEAVIDAVLERLRLMGRSMYDVREQTFALYCHWGEGGLTVAPSEPFHDGVMAALRDALGEHGEVTTGEERDVDGLFPLLAYERGKVSFFRSQETRDWIALANKRGLRILAATTTEAPDADVYVGDTPATEFLA